jgi:hypothetical protein
MKPIIDYEYLHAWAQIEADIFKLAIGVAWGFIIAALVWS